MNDVLLNPWELLHATVAYLVSKSSGEVLTLLSDVVEMNME